MYLKFEKHAVKALATYQKKNPDSVVILDFDDGVGPFSPKSNCTLELAFNIVLAPNAPIGYEPLIDSNIGKVYVKPYSTNQMAEEMTINWQARYSKFILNSKNGVLDPLVGIKRINK